MLTPPPFPLPLSTPILLSNLNETAGHPLSLFRPWSTAIPHSPNHVHPPCRIVICQIILAQFRVSKIGSLLPNPLRALNFLHATTTPHFNSPKFSGQIENQSLAENFACFKASLEIFSAFKFLHLTSRANQRRLLERCCTDTMPKATKAPAMDEEVRDFWNRAGRWRSWCWNSGD
jgi:hypothetical protein